MSDPDYNYIRVKADTAMDPLLRRLLDPPFGTETSERNLMTEAAAEIARLRAQLDDWRASQHYSYIGADGKPVKARDLEDDVIRLRAKVDELGRDLNRAKYGEPDFSWSVHLAVMSSLRARVEAADKLADALEDIADGMGEIELAEIGRYTPHIARAALTAYKETEE